MSHDLHLCFMRRFLAWARSAGLNQTTITTAQTITNALISAVVNPVWQLMQAVVALNKPCQMIVIRTDPLVLLYSQVKVIVPARSPTSMPGMMEGS